MAKSFEGASPPAWAPSLTMLKNSTGIGHSPDLLTADAQLFLEQALIAVRGGLLTWSNLTYESCMIASSFEVFCAPSDVREVHVQCMLTHHQHIHRFLTTERCLQVGNWCQSMLLNRARQRRRLRRGLEDWGNLYQHALNADLCPEFQKSLSEAGWHWEPQMPDDTQVGFRVQASGV